MGMMEIRRRVMEASVGLLPPTYKACDYLQTTGYNSRIDTGVPGNDEALEFDFDYATMTRASYGGVFGSYLSESSRCWRLINPSGTGDVRDYIVTAYNRKAGSSTGVSVVPNDESIVGKRVNFHISFGRMEARCGEFTVTATPKTDTTTDLSERNITIGAVHPTHTGGSIVGRFWHFKIWRDGDLIRSYTPCVRLRDNKAGFYDLANHTFNPSIGTVDFIAGYDE